MADTWYYAQSGQQYGPVSGVQLQQLAAAGRLQPGDLVWQEGTPNWVPAPTVANLMPAPLQAGPAPAPPAGPAGAYAPPAGAAPYGGGGYGQPYDAGYGVERPQRRPQGMSAGALV